MEKINLTNKKFGRITALYPTEERKYRAIVWQCKCDCGNYINVTIQSLKSGNTKSCGCSRYKYNYKEEKLLKYFTSLDFSAKRRKIEFKITLDDIYKQWYDQNGLCNYTNIKLKLPYEKDEFTGSIDRINSSIGYTKNNIQWILKEINFMKGNMSESKFKTICRLVSNGENNVFNFWESYENELR